MTKLLMKIFVGEDVGNDSYRKKCGMLGSITGIVLNFFLAAVKFLAGTLTNSIAITADAVNNLSDAANCTVTMIGFKISHRPADDKHPFGHGRYEYIAGFIVSLAVVVFGFDLLKTSVGRMFKPSELSFGVLPIVILCISVILKIWLYFFYSSLAKKINSPALFASAADSLTDCAATAVSGVSIVVFKVFGINLDAYFGLPVAVLIIVSGVKILKTTLDPLIGQPADKEISDNIRKEIMNCDHILGLHDLMLHSYGADRIFGTVDVEMPSSMSLVDVHNTVDELENMIKEKFSISLTIHVDPIDGENVFYNRMKQVTQNVLKRIDAEITFHDLRVVKSPLETNFIFDAVITERCGHSPQEIKQRIEDEFRKENKSYCALVTVERKYTQ